jgi:hypothetical protein
MCKLPQVQVFAIVTIFAAALVATGCGGGAASGNVQSPGGGGGTTGGGTPQDTYFALNMGPANPWPNSLGVQFGIWRTLGARLRWSDLQPTPPANPTSDPTDPSYQWSSLDNYFSLATANGQKILFTAYYTPTSISQQPGATCQANTVGGQTTGGCYPPVDVATGDTYWKDFLTAVYQHVTANGWHIATWECWNEPNIQSEYYGSDTQALSYLSTMCADLRSTISSLDSSAKFTTPAPTRPTDAGNNNVVTWLSTWLSDPQNVQSADIVAFHGYVCLDASNCTASSAEDVAIGVVNPLKDALGGTPAASMPLWDTEGSDDAGNQAISDPDFHAAFLARFSILQQSAGVATFAYWGWDFGNGINLVDYPGDDPNATGTALNPAGVAWQQLYAWTVGATYTSGCSNASGTIYTCPLKGSSGASELIVWDAANVNSCSNDVCGNTTFTIPSGSSFTRCTDLAGNPCTSGISGGAVLVGAKPVLLQ